jgi:nickel-type superoxide dismutase maturation protease
MLLLLSKFKIIGHSMEPVVRNGDQVLVSGISYLFKNPQKGDTVAFKNIEGEILVKRIHSIKNANYFVLGDNKNDSLDSRSYGLVLRKDILGKVIYKL